jgi:ankyrin repeat protein
MTSTNTTKKHKTSQTKNKTTQKFLLEEADKDGMYPIHLAIQNNDLGTLEVLINNGANIDKYNRDRNTPLLLAIKDNNPQIVAKLLEENADIKKVDANKHSPIEVAINLDYQECIDLLTDYETSKGVVSSKKEIVNERNTSAEFVNSLIQLLNDKIASVTKVEEAVILANEILILLQEFSSLEEAPKPLKAKLSEDIAYRINRCISDVENNIKISNKSLLNLARKIIVIIQDFSKILSANAGWNLTSIESLIEEKIVLSNAAQQKTVTHIFTNNHSAKKEKSEAKVMYEDWYVKNGYRDFNDFVRINNAGAGPINFLKFLNISKERILQKTHCHGTEAIDMVTIKPLKPTSKEEFSLLLPTATKRIKEEEKLLSNSSFDLKEFHKLLDKATREDKLSLDETLQLDKLIRPGRKNKIHLLHFHHNNRYESFWNDLSKEAFLTGATIHLFNPPSNSTTDFIYSGIAAINKLLDADIHPDKIILQSYGDGQAISKEVKNQFHKRGIELTQINYQHSSFFPISYPDFICDHRNLHIYSNTPPKQNIINESKELREFSKFAKHIAKHLDKMEFDKKSQNLTEATSETYSIPQLINTFITASQNFLETFTSHKNPALPYERVENILGILGA